MLKLVKKYSRKTLKSQSYQKFLNMHKEKLANIYNCNVPNQFY